MYSINDHAVPLAHLMSPVHAQAVLDVALAGEATLTQAPRIRQVRYVPGSTLVVHYEAGTVQRSGRQSVETFIAAVLPRMPENTARVEVDGQTVAVWQFPDDPLLPGLSRAMNPTSVLAIFDGLGMPSSEVSLRRRAYRPLRRAVIEATTEDAKAYLKVVRPSRVEDLQRRHSSLSQLLPVPRSHGWNRDLGIVVLSSQPGETLRAALAGPEPKVPSPGEIVGLLDSLPDPPVVPSVVSGPASRAGEFSKLLSAVVPDAAPEIRDVVAACTLATDETEGAHDAVHGDFHSSQILVEEGGITGLVDVDSAGIGQRVHDFAQMVAHLAVLGSESPTAGFNAYGADLLKAFDQLVDPVTLRRNVAGAILGFATGPFRVQEPNWPANTRHRVKLALEWCEAAESAK